MERFTLLSPAKVNLGLKVIAKRSDGYHEIRSIFQMVNLCDVLTFERISAGIEMVSNHAGLTADPNNLVCRAFHLLSDRTGTSWGAKINLTKRIPLAAGLGGGSSNAAAALWGLNRLWQQNLSQEELLELAKVLGSDVPFFLFAPRAYGAGRGEKLEIIPPGRKIALVLLTPFLSISTAWAYANLEPYLGMDPGDIDCLRHLIEAGREEEIGPHLYNTFEAPISSLYPIISWLKKELLRRGAYGALMSGSGPTVFGLFSSWSEAETVYQSMKVQGLEGPSGCPKDGPGWSTFLAETVIDPKALDIIANKPN